VLRSTRTAGIPASVYSSELIGSRNKQATSIMKRGITSLILFTAVGVEFRQGIIVAKTKPSAFPCRADHNINNRNLTETDRYAFHRNGAGRWIIRTCDDPHDYASYTQMRLNHTAHTRGKNIFSADRSALVTLGFRPSYASLLHVDLS
jgi:hypothetical protein